MLDNALRLHRELGEKKGREVLLLRDLQAAYPGFPAGPVFASPQDLLSAFGRREYPETSVMVCQDEPGVVAPDRGPAARDR